MEDFGEESPQVSALVDQICDRSVTIAQIEYDQDVSHRSGDMNAMSTIFDPDSLAIALEERLHLGKFGMSVGVTPGARDVGATHQEKPKGIRPERLAKVFCIDREYMSNIGN